MESGVCRGSQDKSEGKMKGRGDEKTFLLYRMIIFFKAVLKSLHCHPKIPEICTSSGRSEQLK